MNNNKRKAGEKSQVKKEKVAKPNEGAAASAAASASASASASGAVAASTVPLADAKSHSTFVGLATALRKSMEVRAAAATAAAEANRREQAAAKEQSDLFASIPSGKILMMPNGVCLHARGSARLPVVPFLNAKPDIFVCQSCGAKSDMEAHESCMDRYGAETLLQFVYCKSNPVCRRMVRHSLAYIKDFLATTMFHPNRFATMFVVKIRRSADSAVLSFAVSAIEFGSAIDGSWFVALTIKNDRCFTSICVPLTRFLSTIRVIRKHFPQPPVPLPVPVPAVPIESKTDAKKIEPSLPLYPLNILRFNTNDFPTESANDHYTFGPIRIQIHRASLPAAEFKLVQATEPPPILFDGYRFLPPDVTAGTDCIAAFSPADVTGPPALRTLAIPYTLALPIGVQRARYVEPPAAAAPKSIEFIFPFGKPPASAGNNASTALDRSKSGSAAAAATSASATTVNIISDEDDAVISPL
jgi:hypothetical protein